MVIADPRFERRLGALLQAGAILGVLLSASALVALTALGEPLGSWPLAQGRWWTGGGHQALRFVVGLGMLILFATPVAAHAAILWRAARARKLGAVAIVLGLFLILALGFWRTGFEA